MNKKQIKEERFEKVVKWDFRYFKEGGDTKPFTKGDIILSSFLFYILIPAFIVLLSLKLLKGDFRKVYYRRLK